jgi:hypothetical protein
MQCSKCTVTRVMSSCRKTAPVVEYFHINNLGHRLSFYSDTVDQLGMTAAVADVYIPLCARNIMNLPLASNKRYAVCSDASVVGEDYGDGSTLCADPPDPSRLPELLEQFHRLPEYMGGFRHLTDLDLKYGELLREIKLADSGPIPTAILESQLFNAMYSTTHPLAPFTEFVGLHPGACLLWFSYMLDPRRYLNLENPGDDSRFMQVNGLDRTVFPDLRSLDSNQAVSDYAKTLEVPEMMAILVRSMWMRFDKVCDAGLGCPVHGAANVWKDTYSRWLTEESKSPEEAEMEVSKDVARYLRFTWSDYLNGWRTFDPFTFFAPEEAAAFAEAFPVKV